MQPIPKPVTNVTVWPCYNWPPNHGIGPVVPPVISGGEGTYSVGSLIRYLFYNLDLENVTPTYALKLGGTYHATVQYEDGTQINTPKMTCLDDSNNPRFGETVSVGPQSATDQAQTVEPERQVAGLAPTTSMDQLIKLVELTGVTVSQSFRPPAVGEIALIEGATGWYVSTRVGTPHLMGFAVEKPGEASRLYVGMPRITVRGRRADNGSFISLENLTCENAEQPAIFLQTFP